MGTRYLEEDAYEQVGADGHVSVRQRLRNAFAAPLKQWAVRILCGCGGLAAFWDNHASVPIVCVRWLSDLLSVDAATVPDANQQLELAQLRHLTAEDLAGLRRRLGFDPSATDPVNDLIARLQEEVQLK